MFALLSVRGPARPDAVRRAQANSVEMKWNSRGNTCLLLTSTDVDKTGQSYYGETSVYCLDTKGATAHLQPGGYWQ